MAERKANRLSVKGCDALLSPGKYADGDGLYLHIGTGGGKSWVFRFKFNGKRQDMGLGSYDQLPLKAARIEAEAARALLRQDKNPIIERQIAKASATTAHGATAPLFGAFARGLTAQWIQEFKSKAHRRAWMKTFGDDAEAIKSPYAELLLEKRVDQIDTAAVLAVLQPLAKKHVTASRVRGRIERVLDAAKVLGYRSGENPARWEGHLEVLLKRPKKVVKRHHKAMPYADLPAFIRDLRNMTWTKMKGGKGKHTHHTETVTESISALALEFTILTASRTSEVILAPRREINFEKLVWTIPAERMKEKREHRVPLSPRMVEILRKVWPFANDSDAYIFRGQSGDGHLSNMAMSMCLRGLVGEDGYTVHGFRSTFRDWVGDETDFPREVAEAALAHLVGDQAEQAYRRGDALERRRRLMHEWDAYLAP